jgi:hypothetical protein
MDEEIVELSFGQKALRLAKSVVLYVLRDILLVDLGFLVAVLLSFLVFGKLSAIAVSERMVWVGMIVISLGGIAIVATGVAGRSFGVPVFIRKPEDAKKLLEKAPEIRQEQEKRYNAGARLWLIGMGCIAIGALIEHFLT